MMSPDNEMMPIAMFFGFLVLAVILFSLDHVFMGAVACLFGIMALLVEW